MYERLSRSRSDVHRLKTKRIRTSTSPANRVGIVSPINDDDGLTNVLFVSIDVVSNGTVSQQLARRTRIVFLFCVCKRSPSITVHVLIVVMLKPAARKIYRYRRKATRLLPKKFHELIPFMIGLNSYSRPQWHIFNFLLVCRV